MITRVAQDLIQLAPLPTDVARELLFRHLGTSNGNVDEAAVQLVQGLDCLPVTIMQAAVYINENNTTVTKYLETFVQFSDTVKPDGSIRIHRLFHLRVQKCAARAGSKKRTLMQMGVLQRREMAFGANDLKTLTLLSEYF